MTETTSIGLPIRTTIPDIEAVCSYLATKPTGASIEDMRKVLDSSVIDGRKLSAVKTWKLAEVQGGKFRVTDLGRAIVRKGGEGRPEALRTIIRAVGPYLAAMERAAHNNEESLLATEVGAYWHQHFKGIVSENDKVLNDQAVCFFHLVQGAGLGNLTIGRKGSPTRVELKLAEVKNFVGNLEVDSLTETGKFSSKPDGLESAENSEMVGDWGNSANGDLPVVPKSNNRVFITHGKNQKILEQLKEIVQFGRFVPIVAEEHETPSKPVPDKVMDDMRTCSAGVIHVASEEVLVDSDGKPRHKLNDNVLIEIGAAMALYRRRFILLVEKGLQLPSNLQGLYQCRYEGDKLDGEATMKLLKAFNEFSGIGVAS